MSILLYTCAALQDIIESYKDRNNIYTSLYLGIDIISHSSQVNHSRYYIDIICFEDSVKDSSRTIHIRCNCKKCRKIRIQIQISMLKLKQFVL